MPRFFVSKNDICADYAKITGSDVNHITKVLRLKPGSEITICDGGGFDYKAEISSLSKDEVLLKILDKVKCNTEPEIKVTLFQGLPKSSKMEYIIEKCTELGFYALVPVQTMRSVAKINGDNSMNKKLERWRKIADESVKQCQRGIIPQIHPAISFRELPLLLGDFDLVIFCYEAEKDKTLKSVLTENKNAKNIAVIIGPEGGFDESEAMLVKQSGAKTVTLGNRILRTETAGHTVITAVMYEYEEI